MVGLCFHFEHGIGYLLQGGTLNIETSRTRGLAPEQRICLMCDDGACKDDVHFLICCPKYDHLGGELFDSLAN